MNSAIDSHLERQSLFDSIPNYGQILNDLGKGNLRTNFSLTNRRSKLSHSLNEILFDEKNDELSYFVLFIDSKSASNYVKFLLDLNNFELTFSSKNKMSKCDSCQETDSFAATNNCECFRTFSKSKHFPG